MRRRDGNAVFPSTRTRVRGRPLTPRLILSWPRVAERRYTIYFPTLRYNYTAVLVHYYSAHFGLDPLLEFQPRGRLQKVSRLVQVCDAPDSVVVVDFGGRVVLARKVVPDQIGLRVERHHRAVGRREELLAGDLVEYRGRGIQGGSAWSAAGLKAGG